MTPKRFSSHEAQRYASLQEGIAARSSGEVAHVAAQTDHFMPDRRAALFQELDGRDDNPYTLRHLANDG